LVLGMYSNSDHTDIDIIVMHQSLTEGHRKNTGVLTILFRYESMRLGYNCAVIEDALIDLGILIRFHFRLNNRAKKSDVSSCWVQSVLFPPNLTLF